MDFDKNEKHDIKVDGVIDAGKQFDIEVTLPEDYRNVIYGIVKDCYGQIVEDAVVKLVEVVKDNKKEKRLPVSHTITDKNGEFVFGPLCPNKYYELQIWADRVRHFKICADGKHSFKCLHGEKMNDCIEQREDNCEDLEDILSDEE